MSAFSDDELERYARHIVLREIGGPGQKKLKSARVLVIGAGGLGSPALLYLAAAGVGTLGIVDDDEVSLSNMQRQVLHATEAVGLPKTDSAVETIARVNPEVSVETYTTRLTTENAEKLIGLFDLVLDGSDNFDTRYLVARTAAHLKKTLVFAAIGQWEGQLSTFKPWTGGPCYECIFPDRPAAGLAPTCADAGVMGALAGVMGAMQAAEAVKEIVGSGESLSGALLLYDALCTEFRKIRVKKNPDCPVCGGAE